ncbi:hypothetical protein [Nibricoccus sp. IMCC34717]|uniref:hypothetical protein n=1 Tax=Nibricoccus sp. IMCC34717 TaxID=3034021 RepID=UPI00384D4141
MQTSLRLFHILFFSGGVAVVWYYFNISCVEVTFADYHNILPRIETLLSTGFDWRLIDFQNAGHYHPGLAALCLLNAYFLGTSIAAEFWICIVLLGLSYWFLISKHHSTLINNGVKAVWLKSSAFGALVTLCFFNLNKYEHWTFPFTGIEYFLTTCLLPMLAWQATKIVYRGIGYSVYKCTAFSIIFVLVIIGLSGGRGPIICIAFAAVVAPLIIFPRLYIFEVPRLRSAIFVTLMIACALLYNSLLINSPVQAGSLARPLTEFLSFPSNLLGSWLLGPGVLDRLKILFPIWIVGVVVFLFTSFHILNRKQLDLFPLLLIGFGVTGALSITFARVSYGSEYAITSKYIPVTDLLVIGVFWIETQGYPQRWARVAIWIRMVACVVLCSAYLFCFNHEIHVGPHRRHVFEGVSKFFFAPSLYEEFSRYVSPNPEEARKCAEIVREFSLCSAARDDLTVLTPYNIRFGLKGDTNLFSATGDRIEFFLYKRSTPLRFCLGIVNAGSETVDVVRILNGKESSIRVAQGGNFYVDNWNRKGVECTLILPKGVHKNLQIYAFFD